jgi:hypothetical protein
MEISQFEMKINRVFSVVRCWDLKAISMRLNSHVSVARVVREGERRHEEIPGEKISSLTISFHWKALRRLDGGLCGELVEG